MLSSLVIIPYRNRQSQLDYFIEHSVPAIQKELPNSKVMVIEQTNGKLFNRGKLLNVAFKEYKDKTEYFITQDVDLNPTDLCLKEHYCRELDSNNKHVLAILTSPCDTLGGIVKIRNETIQEINGFPNDIWGWGTEDKALKNRADFFGVQKETVFLRYKNKPDDKNYFTTFNDIDDRERQNQRMNTIKHYNQFPKLTPKQKQTQIMKDGLNNINYTIVERRELHPIVELIKVEI